MTFTSAEQDALRSARLVVHRGVLILEAQPPADAQVLAELEAKLTGPIPSQLRALWATTFGGRLNYDLRANFKKGPVALSFTELFFPGSDGYHDLWGWIDHEGQLAREVEGPSWNGRLEALPFGGFEYTDRLYVLVSPAKEAGTVVGWMHGLPPAWRFSQGDQVGRVARDLDALFDALHLEVDPWTADPKTFPSGTDMVTALDSLAQQGAAGRSAAEKLKSLVLARVLDWRTAMLDGSIAEKPSLVMAALEASARADDLETLERLRAAGCDVTPILRGGASALEHALSSGSMKVARRLIELGLPVNRSLLFGAASVDVALAAELLAKGAAVDEHAVFNAVTEGRVEVANLMLEALPQLSSLQLAIRARERARTEADDAARIEAGTLHSSVSAAECRARAERLERLADRVDPTIRS